MYELIQISKINDFIFCPYSLYFHSIYENFKQDIYHEVSQKRGKIRHENIENSQYSTSKNFLQGLSVYSEKYKLIGKIDIYDKKNKSLIERKYKVKQIFDGYKYQLYAEMFCMQEMGYEVDKLFIHSLSDNKRYEISLPNETEVQKFKYVLEQIWKFDFDETKKVVSPLKCKNCIYRQLCEYNDADVT